MTRWLVEGGGNGHGAVQAGVNQAIVDLRGPNFFNKCCGVSAGAINAGAMATRMVPEASALWRNITEDKIIKRRSLLKFAASVVGGRLLPGASKQTGFHDTTPLRDTLREFFAGAQGKPMMPLYVGRVDLFSGQYVDHISGGIADAIWQSTIIPILMKAEVQNTALWVDGGIHNVKPLSRVVSDGNDGDEVYIVNAGPHPSAPRSMKTFPRKADVLDIIEATIEYAISVATIRDMALFIERNTLPGYKHFKTIVIEPDRSVDLGDGNGYSRDILRKRFDHGYAVAERVLRSLE